MSGLLVDLFAGCGGASTGIEAALGRSVDVAINHDATAVAAHAANHPKTRHFKSDVWEVDPTDATGGRQVELLHASPDCRHFSRAKGGVPRSPRVRSLAWVVVRWAKAVRPRVITLENVVEFKTWGPLGADGAPLKSRAGETFDEWVQALVRLGYQVESRVLDASLYGAPTRRRRLFIVARRDGQPIAWPKPTHGPGLLPLRTAAECIDWSLPCPSIFDRKRPLAKATLRRVAWGIRRFVLGKAEPFVVNLNMERGHGEADSLSVRSAASQSRDRSNHDSDAFGVPLLRSRGRCTGSGGSGEDVEPRDGEAGGAHASEVGETRSLVAPLVAPNMANNVPRTATAPMPTITGGNRNLLVAPTLIQTGHGEREGQTPRVPGLAKPLGAVVAGGSKRALVAAFLAHHYGGEVGREASLPLGVVTARDHHSLVAAHLTKWYATAHGQRADEPLHAVTTKARFALVATFLERHGIAGPHVVRVGGEAFAIADVGLRMLEPHELLRAQFGPHAERYDLGAATSKAARIRLIGNSVCPQVAEALVRANLRGGARVARQPDLFGVMP
jgi:DNA (cytosine-5)-methyltransferase 1